LTELCAGRRLSLDGEVVALGVNGAPEFERLQRRLGVNPSPALVSVTFVAFDVLDADGPTVDVTYRARREVLEELNLAHRHLVVPGYQTGIAPASLFQVAKRYC
jgi:bifunctional non-homologous end joining protein LigD